MKHQKLLFISFMLSTATLFATPYIDLGLTMGGMAPDTDLVTRTTFGKNFYWQGSIGLIDSNGWELRANLSRYVDTSHNPADIGTNLQLDVTPLMASLIYHIGSPSSIIRPYIGGGIGGYFYEVRDDIYGSLETGIEYGAHVLGGVKLNLLENFYIAAEYNKSFISPVFFNNAENFNSSMLTIGAGITFPIVSAGNSAPAASYYRYSQEEEDLLLKIQNVSYELQTMRKDYAALDQEITTFYRDTRYDENSDKFMAAYHKIQFKEKKANLLKDQIKEAEQDLAKLKNQFKAYQIDNQPVEQHVVYIQKNYYRSPRHLRFNNGFLIRPHHPYVRHYHYDNDSSTSGGSGSTVEDRKDYAEKKKERLIDLKNRGI